MKTLTEDEMKYLVELIAEPTFKYMMKRVSKHIIDDKEYNRINVNQFLTLLCAAIALIDANALRWMENFYQINSGQLLDFEKLREVHYKNLSLQLKTILQ